MPTVAALPVLSNGNTKLGRCLVLSRAVGDTCSPDCPYLTGNGVPAHSKCYARHTEERFGAARRCGQQNASVRTSAVRGMLELAERRNVPVRLHERGDFGNGRRQSIDARYVGAVERGFRSFAGRVRAWTYTHIYHRRLARLAELGLSIYASVHGSRDVKRARSAGFQLFALVLPYRPAKCKPQIRSMPVYDGPQMIERDGERYLICPAQYRENGSKHVTCERCGYCVNGRGNVAFLTH